MQKAFDSPRFRMFFIISTVAFALAWGYNFTKIEIQSASLKNVVHTQQYDREDSVLKNIEARKDDCGQQNELRAGLRTNVEEGQKSVPLLLRAVPQLNTKEILAVNNASVKRELYAFRNIDCEEYANKALPSSEIHKVSLEVQENELKEQQVILSSLIKTQREFVLHAAESRVTTVSQRCELTKLFLDSATKNRSAIQSSLTGCEKQLVKVKFEVSQAK